MFNTKTYKAILTLEDKTTYYGWSFNQVETSIGEVVFNTGMTGYQEIITDPSYAGQIITFTYPELGNTGINTEDDESRQPFIKGIIAKNLCQHSSNWRESNTFTSYLKEHKIAHIYGIDTRALTKHLRTTGTMNGYISTDPAYINKSKQFNWDDYINMNRTDMVKQVSINENINCKSLHLTSYIPRYQSQFLYNEHIQLSISIIDFGLKYNIIRCLQNLSPNINIHIMPAHTTLAEILATNPDSILLSNGPGDPSDITYAIETVQGLIQQRIPIFGICMGHQIFSLSMGLQTFKLKFGHRGINHPTGCKQHINITSQNHGFAVNTLPLLQEQLIISETNYNDGTTASIVHRKSPYFTVQYHPEASPGPHDTKFMFEHFIHVTSILKKYPSLNEIC
uniref:Carbamoyl phosphate synthase small chain n=1 Tax=Trichogloeopsis pedicellata TaxID=1495610 RepID=A0A1G4P095_9FLOR|nr:Carbamoyl phosphate synthase small subunit [Trichogloeopsis pedicellata]SCW24328.1 Carbamoyl phosphate synthase small subunit [Trichogloeopsis pedicellata]